MSLFRRLMAAKVKPTPAAKPVDGVELVPGLQQPVLRSELGAAPVRTSAPVAIVALGNCKAVNAETGQRCALLAGHAGPHRHGRTSFWRIAEPGQRTFARRELVDEAGGARHSSPFHATHTGGM